MRSIAARKVMLRFINVLRIHYTYLLNILRGIYSATNRKHVPDHNLIFSPAYTEINIGKRRRTQLPVLLQVYYSSISLESLRET
jgi:hypothetical protein